MICINLYKNFGPKKSIMYVMLAKRRLGKVCLIYIHRLVIILKKLESFITILDTFHSFADKV